MGATTIPGLPHIDDRGYVVIGTHGYPSWWSDREIVERARGQGVAPLVIETAIAQRHAYLAALERVGVERAAADRARAEATASAARHTEMVEDLRVQRGRALARYRACPHASVSTRTVGYTHTIDDDPRADGAVCEVDTCDACGAARSTNVNGHHSASTGWYMPDASDRV